MKKKFTKKQFKDLEKACDEARKRVSGYSKEKRADLLRHARKLINEGKV